MNWIKTSDLSGKGFDLHRRAFLRAAGLAAAGAMVSPSRLLAGSSGSSDERPNLLVILTDQQFADAMSCCIGKEYIHTPNMDSLAAAGMRFTRAYTANPLCVPVRTSSRGKAETPPAVFDGICGPHVI